MRRQANNGQPARRAKAKEQGKSEAAAKSRIRLRVGSRFDTTLFNNPNGNTSSARRGIQFGLTPGASDLIGWFSIWISGFPIAVFVAIEVKRPRGGRPSKKQINFIEQVKKAGGIAGIARNELEAWALIEQWLSERGITEPIEDISPLESGCLRALRTTKTRELRARNASVPG